MANYHFKSDILIVVLFILLLTDQVYGQTFSGVGGLPFPPSGTMGITQSTCDVSGVGILGGCKMIENVTIDLDHTFDGDIALMLIAPDGTFLELSSSNGGAGDDYSITSFSDFAAINVVSGAPPYNGTYNAEGRQNTSLNNPYPNTNAPGTFTFTNTFNGVNADGQWILYLNDYVGADVGFLHSWSITFFGSGTGFTVDAGPDITICAGEDVGLTAVNTAPNAVSYSWSTGNTGPSITLPDVNQSILVTVTVTDQSGCIGTDQVAITVNNAPTANPVTYQLCESVPPDQAVFDLTTIVLAIGNGLPVTFYTDINLTNLISNPGAYLSGSTTLYAVASTGNCTSAPVPIDLVVTQLVVDMTIVPDGVCFGELVPVQFTVPVPGVYTYEYELDCTNGVETNTITTSANPVFFGITSDCVFRLLSATQVSTGCTTTFSPPKSDNIIVETAPAIMVSPIQICAGETVDLSNFVTTDAGATLQFHSGLPVGPFNQLASPIVMPPFSTTYYAVSSTTYCETIMPVPVIVQPGGVPVSASTTICDNNGILNLSSFVNPPSLTGIWSGTGITGNNFDPTGLSGAISLTFDPDETCYTDGTLTVTVIQQQSPQLGTADLCQSASLFNLGTLSDPMFPNGSWSGPGVTASFFDPSGQMGNVTLTFTSSDQCVNPVSTTITILPPPIPNIQSNIVVCQGTTIMLTDYFSPGPGELFNIYSALPISPLNEVTNFNVTIFGSTTFYVKITDSNGCFAISPLVINATPGGVPQLGTANICQSDVWYDLTLLNDPNAGPGSWTGPGVTGNILDLTGQSGNVNLTFTPLNVCFTPVDTDVFISVPANPVLATTNLCSASGNYNLNQLADPLYPAGTWSGPGVSGNIFNPSQQSGPVLLTFNPSDFCVLDASVTVQVTQSQLPMLTNATICETTLTFDLTLLQDPLFMAGNWAGPGVSGQFFNSTGLTGAQSLTFFSSENCVLAATTNITIQQQQQPLLSTLSICETENPIDLSSLTDALFTTGTWTGNGVNNGIFNPDNLAGNVTLQFVSDMPCTIAATTTILVNTSPYQNNLQVICDQQTQTYTVQFSISGGDPQSYMVNGIPSGADYISTPIASQTPYMFEISDANQCASIALQGNKNCACANSAGTMNFINAPYRVCVSDTVTLVYNNDQLLEANDKLVFILHDQPGLQAGNILLTSSSPVFYFPPGAIEGTTYYVSAISADSLSDGSLDFNDACFSITAGVPVTFYKPASAILPVDNFCGSTCTTITFQQNGIPPFQLILAISNDGQLIKKDTLITTQSVYPYTFCPSASGNTDGFTSIELLQLNDDNCAILASGIQESFFISPPINIKVSGPFCPGDSVVVNGQVYDINNRTGTEIIASSSAGGCDSIIQVDLNYYSPATEQITQALCVSEFITINGHIYDKNKLTGTEVIPDGSIYGCDSTIVINLTLTQEIVSQINPILCPGEKVVINGKVYDENKLSGTDTIAGSGPGVCDSIINVSLQYKTASVSQLNRQLCSGDFIMVNGKRYDENKKSGNEIILNGAKNGCDSTINIQLQFYPEAFGLIRDTLCVGDSITIGGTVYHGNNTSDVQVLKNASINGCDSTLTVQIYFYPVLSDTIRLKLKSGEDTLINGTLFSELYSEGLTVANVVTSAGCATYTYVIVRFEPDVLTASINSEPETCPGKNDGQIVIERLEGCSNYEITINGIAYPSLNIPLTVRGLAPGKYVVSIAGSGGCLYVEEVLIPIAVATDFNVRDTSFEMLLNQSIVLDAGITPVPDQVQWEPATFLSCADCLQPAVSNLTADTEYELFLTDNNGCIFRHIVHVKLKYEDNDIVFPNIFSPNGDGGNETFIIKSTDTQKIHGFDIFDRWGSKVYTIRAGANETELAWDGKYKGSPVVPGVYVFLADITDSRGNRKWVSGSVTIAR